MDPENVLDALAIAATEIQASIRGLQLRLRHIQAETAAQVHGLHQQMEQLQQQIDEVRKQRVHALVAASGSYARLVGQPCGDDVSLSQIYNGAPMDAK